MTRSLLCIVWVWLRGFITIYLRVVADISLTWRYFLVFIWFRQLNKDKLMDEFN